MRQKELEERRRCEQILSERKKERDTLMFRFLREPLMRRREAKRASSLRAADGADVGDEGATGGKDRMCQSVPDLDEAMRVLRREDQNLDAR